MQHLCAADRVAIREGEPLSSCIALYERFCTGASGGCSRLEGTIGLGCSFSASCLSFRFAMNLSILPEDPFHTRTISHPVSSFLPAIADISAKPLTASLTHSLG